jgi:nitroimidazol reductase NimA-like FMN-containing flavoprotein (pyridoxamine 5'-phosphate oxidase superfamily)
LRKGCAYAPHVSASGGRGNPRELSRAEIDDFLREQRIARLGCHAGGETYVVPLIYAYEDCAVVAVTTEGRKTAMLRENPRVCVEVDEYDTDGRGSWRSVIAYGTYGELTGDAIEPALALLRERFRRAAGRDAEPRQLGPNVVVLRISLDKISGRAVER